MALILNILLATLYLIMNDPKILSQSQQVPCLFFFGDSGFDNGNNNYLLSVFKANYPPYGVDYPGGPTGRFNNGRNKADFLAQFLGFNRPIPPYISLQIGSSEFFRGVNYASGGAGIRFKTGKHLGLGRYTLFAQLNNHGIMKRTARMSGPLSATRLDAHLNKCLYAVYVGSDDYIKNYFLPQMYLASRLFRPEQYAERLIQEYSTHLKTLYDHGARKVAIFGIGLLGCLPQQIAMFPRHASPCVNHINNAVQQFNSRLRPLVDSLNNNLNGAQFIYINTSGINVSLKELGFNLTNTACCKVGKDGVCLRNQAPCANRRQTLFFDNLHPVEAFDEVIAGRAYRSNFPTDSYPYDIRTLALTSKVQNNVTISQSVWSQK